ncbi:hypothetical protein EK904_003165 [Melospiza melodia maxima]|nr:hypothetical protein EK904_003165 [Melospiza melodia maxima]
MESFESPLYQVGKRLSKKLFNKKKLKRKQKTKLKVKTRNKTESLESTITIPDIRLHSNPSAFNVYCNVRHCVLEWQKKEASVSLASKNSVQSGDSDSDEEEEPKEPPIKLPKAKSLFQLLLEITVRSTGMNDSTGQSLTALSCACLFSLVAAWGETGRTLQAISAILTNNGSHACQTIQVPTILNSLQRSVQAVLVGKIQIQDWFSNGIKKAALMHKWPLKEISVDEDDQCLLQSDGFFLYLLCKDGLYKIGSGYSGTVRGHIYNSTSRIKNRKEKKSWLGYAQGYLLYRDANNHSMTAIRINPETLEQDGTVTLPDCHTEGQNILFTDGEYINQIAASRDNKRKSLFGSMDQQRWIAKSRRQSKPYKPKKIIKMEGKIVISTACNNGSSSVISKDGELYMFGKDAIYSDSTSLVTDLKGHFVTQVAMGKAHTCVLMKNGEVWTFGVNNKGQCGRDTGSMSQGGKAVPVPGVNIEEHLQLRQEEKRQRVIRRHRLEEGREETEKGEYNSKAIEGGNCEMKMEVEKEVRRMPAKSQHIHQGLSALTVSCELYKSVVDFTIQQSALSRDLSSVLTVRDTEKETGNPYAEFHLSWDAVVLRWPASASINQPVLILDYPTFERLCLKAKALMYVFPSKLACKHKGQLGRPILDMPYWNAKPAPMPNIGSKYGRKATWIGASGDQTFLRIDEALINSHVSPKCQGTVELQRSSCRFQASLSSRHAIPSKNVTRCLDTLAAMQDLKMGVANTEEETQAVMKVYSKEDYSVVNRFESHGGGWGYSAHSVEAIRFCADTDILLGGLGLFGGRGEYTAKIKLFELGPDGGDHETDGDLLAETDVLAYDCAARLPTSDGSASKGKQQTSEPVHILKRSFARTVSVDIQEANFKTSSSRLLAAVMSALCHTSVKLTSIFPIAYDGEALLRSMVKQVSTENDSALAHRFPLLVAHMEKLSQSEENVSGMTSFREVLEKMLSDHTGDATHSHRWTSLELVKGTYTTDDSPSDIAEIRLDKVVPLKENVKYAVRLRNYGSRTANGDGGMTTVQCPDGVTFTFSTCSLSSNGTNQTRGQIPQILYYRSEYDGDLQSQLLNKANEEDKNCSRALSVVSAVVRAAKDLLHRALAVDDIPELLSSSSLFSMLLPLIIAYIGPVAAAIPKVAVEVFGLVQQLLPSVAVLNQKYAPPAFNPNQSTDSTTGNQPEQGLSACTTSNHYAVVESEHPYKPASVTHYKVTFPECVRWITIEFDTQCGTAQSEDVLRLLIPVRIAQSLGFGPKHTSVHENLNSWIELKKFSGSSGWPTMVLVLPGNEALFSLETASDYVKDEKACFYGFKCYAIGYEFSPGSDEGIIQLEKELANLGGSCAAALMKKDLALPIGSEFEEDLEILEEAALQVQSNEQSFLEDFIACVPGSSGGRLARWLQPDSYADPQKTSLILNKDDIRCGWPTVITVQTKDQYGEVVHVPNMKVEVKAIPVSQKKTSLQQEQVKKVQRIPGSPATAVSPSSDMTFGGLPSPKLDSSYEPMIVKEARYIAITMMKVRKFVAKDSAGLRIRSHPSLQSEQIGIVKVNGSITFIDEIHNDDGVWLRLNDETIKKYVPNMNGYTEAWCLSFNQHLGKSLLVPVDESRSNADDFFKDLNSHCPQEAVMQEQDMPFLRGGPGVYKVVKTGPSGHNIRSCPNLRGIPIGMLVLGNKVKAVGEVTNSEGTWVQMDKNSMVEFCESDEGEAWSLARDRGDQLSAILNSIQSRPNLPAPSIFDQAAKAPSSLVHSPFVFGQPLSFQQPQPQLQICAAELQSNRPSSAPAILALVKLHLEPQCFLSAFSKTVEGAQKTSTHMEHVFSLCFVLLRVSLSACNNSIMKHYAGDRMNFTGAARPISPAGKSDMASKHRADCRSPKLDVRMNRATAEQKKPRNTDGLSASECLMLKSDAAKLRSDSHSRSLSPNHNTLQTLKTDGRTTPGLRAESPGPGTRSTSPKTKTLTGIRSGASSPRSSSPNDKTTLPQKASSPVKTKLDPPRERSKSDSYTLDPDTLRKKKVPLTEPLRGRSTSPKPKITTKDGKSAPETENRAPSPHVVQENLHSEVVEVCTSSTLKTDSITDTTCEDNTEFRSLDDGSNKVHFSIGKAPLKDEQDMRASPKVSRKCAGRHTRPKKEKSNFLFKGDGSKPIEPAKQAMSPSVAECARAVFAAFLWHEGIVHDAMACSSFLKFNPELSKEHAPIRSSLTQQPAEEKETKLKNRHSLEISSALNMFNISPHGPDISKMGSINKNKVLSMLKEPPLHEKCEDGKNETTSFETSSHHTMKSKSPLPLTLQHLVAFWEDISLATIKAASQNMIFPSPGSCAVLKKKESDKDNKKAKKEKKKKEKVEARPRGNLFGEMAQLAVGGPEKDTICELCGESHPYPVTYHMRQAHPGCGRYAGGQGYNSIGHFCGGWAGNCGDGGIGGSTWYLVCDRCREKYLREKQAAAREKDDNLFQDEMRYLRSTSVPAPYISVTPDASPNVFEEPESNMKSMPPSLETSPITDTDLAKRTVFQRSYSVVASEYDKQHSILPARVKAIPRRRVNSGDAEVGSSLLRHPSPELSRLISAHSSLSKGERNFQWPVLAFVIQHHDLEGLEIAMKQALRKSACRVFAMEAFNWLLCNVIQTTSLHDILWHFVASLTPAPVEPEEEEDEENKSNKENAEQELCIVVCLKDLTSIVDIKTSSRPAMIGSLTDGSTETFWESGDEDKNKTKNITINCVKGINARYVCVHVDNSRDLGNKVTSMTFLTGKAVEDLCRIKQVDLDSRHIGWVTSELPGGDNHIIKIELKGPENTLRVRQVKILGWKDGESIKIAGQISASVAQQRNCESETLRVFRLITSQVFGKLISGDAEPTPEQEEKALLSSPEGEEKVHNATSDADLKEHMVGIIFSRSKLTNLQKQVCAHIVQAIRMEATRVREEWEHAISSKENANSQPSDEDAASDAYCFELLSMVLALSGSNVGRQYLAQQLTLLQDLFSLLHTASPRVQRQVSADRSSSALVTSLLRRVLPEVTPSRLASIIGVKSLPPADISDIIHSTEKGDWNKLGILDMFLGCIAKALTVQLKAKGTTITGTAGTTAGKGVTTVTLPMIFNSSYIRRGESHWWMKGSTPTQISEIIIKLIKDMAAGHLSEAWSRVTKNAIAETIIALTKMEEEYRSPVRCIATTRPMCDNHDDGETAAIILCNVCGNLCTDCDRFLHLHRRTKTHQRQESVLDNLFISNVFKEEEEAIKVDLHEGCGRTKLFWLMALADSKTMKAMVEFREQTGKPTTSSSEACRFCGCRSGTELSAVGSVCSDADCQEYAKIACSKTHPCGHPCGGVKNEEHCLPCLHGCDKNATTLKQDADDMCMICFTEALSAAPAIQNKINHTVLKDLLDPIKELYEDVRRKALMRLEYEGLHKSEAITTPGVRFYNDPAGYAMNRYAYYVCYKCKKAYFGGEARCDAEAGQGDDYDPRELICGACSDVSRAQINMSINSGN